MEKETKQKLDSIKKDIVKQFFMLPLAEKMEAYGDLSSWCIEGMLFEFNREGEML